MDQQEMIADLKRKGIIIGVPILIVIVLLFAFKPWAQIEGGEVGVVKSFGEVQESVLDQGLHFIIPVKEKVTIMDVRVQISETRADASSKDLQQVKSTVALNYHIIPSKANVIFKNIGKDFKERIIDPAVQEVVKAVSARYTAEELITKRAEVSDAMKKDLTTRLKINNIQVDAFSIVNFSFSDAYQQEVEAKQVAEQRVKKSKLELDRIKIEKEQKITNAQAEAEALRLQRQNISPDLIKLRQIEASLEAIKKWDGHLPSVTSGAVPFISTESFKARKK